MLTLIIKYFNKYKLIRKVLLFLNWINLSLFSIFVIDIYDSNLISNIIEWIRSTHLYKILIEILENKTDKLDKVEKVKDIQLNEIIPEIEDSSKSKSMRSYNQSIERIDR
jgi:hypothetical protein